MLQFQTIEPNTLGLLKNLQVQSFLGEFYLVGGTAIALHLGHRMSIDLDLFTFGNFDPNVLLEQLSGNFSTIGTEVISPNTLLVKIERIKTDFIKYKYPAQYPVCEEEGIRLLALEDLVSMKLSAVAQRGRKKDFYDLYYLFQKFSLPQMVSLYEDKFGSPSVFPLLKSLTYFEDAESDPPPVVFEKITWPHIKKSIQQQVHTF